MNVSPVVIRGAWVASCHLAVALWEKQAVRPCTCSSSSVGKFALSGSNVRRGQGYSRRNDLLHACMCAYVCTLHHSHLLHTVVSVVVHSPYPVHRRLGLHPSNEAENVLASPAPAYAPAPAPYLALLLRRQVLMCGSSLRSVHLPIGTAASRSAPLTLAMWPHSKQHGGPLIAAEFWDDDLDYLQPRPRSERRARSCGLIEYELMSVSFPYASNLVRTVIGCIDLLP